MQEAAMKRGRLLFLAVVVAGGAAVLATNTPMLPAYLAAIAPEVYDCVKR
jgi:hypothetical protein